MAKNKETKTEVRGKQPPSRRETAIRDLRLFGNVRVLCACAMFAALSFVLAYLAKLIQGPGPLRFTVENLPVIAAGLLFGPAAGVAVGVGADLLSCLASGMSVNPLITVSVGVIGLLAGGISHYLIRRPGVLQTVVCECVCHVVGSMVMKTLALHAWGYEWAILLWRIPIYFGVIAVESAVICLLEKNTQILHEIEALYRK